MRQLVVLALVAVLVGVHRYFRSRANQPPSAMERRLALGWLWVRRVVCYFAAAICLLAGFALVAHGLLTQFDAMLIVGTVLMLALAGVFTHWGVYGMGLRRYDSSDDRPTHLARKQRYGWRE